MHHLTKVRFLNDVCLRQMMTATPNDVRFAMKSLFAGRVGADLISFAVEHRGFCAYRFIINLINQSKYEKCAIFCTFFYFF